MATIAELLLLDRSGIDAGRFTTVQITRLQRHGASQVRPLLVARSSRRIEKIKAGVCWDWDEASTGICWLSGGRRDGVPMRNAHDRAIRTAERMIRVGATFEQVEEYVDGLELGDKEKTIVWLMAWAKLPRPIGFGSSSCPMPRSGQRASAVSPERERLRSVAATEPPAGLGRWQALAPRVRWAHRCSGWAAGSKAARYRPYSAGGDEVVEVRSDDTSRTSHSRPD